MRAHLACSALLLAAAAPAQQVITQPAAAHGAIVASKDGLVLPAGEFAVGELIEACAAFLCRNYLYDLDTVTRRGSFVLQRTIALDALGSEELLYALLATRDLVALPVDEQRGVYQVIALDVAPWLLASLPWRTPTEILRRPRLHELIVTALEVRHVDARALANVFRQHADGQASPRPALFAAFAADDRLLLLRGYRDQIAQAVLTVQQLDRASAPESAPAAAPALQQRVEVLERELAELKTLLAARGGSR
jgi:hypothetical protein